MIKWLKGFELSANEAKAIWLLCSLIVLGVLFLALWPKTEYNGLSEETITRMDSIIVVMRKSNEKLSHLETEQNAVEVTAFNVDTITASQLVDFGVSLHIANRFVKFRDLKGGFYSIEDVSKVYGITDSLLQALGSFMEFPEKMRDSTFNENETWGGAEQKVYERKRKSDGNNYSKTPGNDLLVLDLNSVTAVDLLRINGIGSVLSSRIIKFRTSIGGFYTTKQLFDVYGVDSQNVVLDNIELTVTKDSIKIMNLNSVPREQLAAHAYITSYQAKVVDAYRKQHGRFSDVKQLLDTKVFNADDLERLSPYLTVE